MRRTKIQLTLITAIIAVQTSLLSQVAPSHSANMKKGLELFKTKVKGLFMDQCIRCHGGEKIKGKLDMSTRAKLLKGGFEEKGFVSGDHKNSFLWKTISHEAEPFMPNKKPKMKQEDIDVIAQWIDLGAPYDAPLVKQDKEVKEFVITEDDRNFWSFLPIAKTEAPELQAKTNIDKFVLAKLQEKGLKQSGEADKVSLIRRLFLDMVGMPPSVAEVDAFISGKVTYENLVDKLLKDERYGERWARHWLDVARFAESTGFEHDYDRKNAYHYRDFVIRAMNSDMPFNKFMRWQIAGDETEPNNADALAATGFLGAGVFPTQLTEREFESARYEELDDMANTTSVAFLGLTIGCARCHDHKYDPLSAKDYYNMVASFTKTKRADVTLDVTPENEKKAYQERHNKELNKLQKEFENTRKLELARLADKLKNPKELQKLSKQNRAPKNVFNKLLAKKVLIDKEKTSLENWYFRYVDKKGSSIEGKLNALKKRGSGKKIQLQVNTEGLPNVKHHANGRKYPHFYPQTHFLDRGDPNRKKEVVTQKFFEVLMRNGKKEDHWIQTAPKDSRTPFSRTSLANWIEDVDNGAGNLMARVIVNRIWQHHFGVGIVDTPNDFGFQGKRPTHPELLEWLAGELIKSGWSLKHIHKLVLTSNTYRISSEGDSSNVKIDPINSYLWKYNKRRVEAEVIRDSIAQISGMLDNTMFGPGFKNNDMKRRSIYFFLKRSHINPALQLFDFPEPLVSQGKRPVTTIAPQALYFMNNDFIRKNAVYLAQSLMNKSGSKIDDAIHQAFKKTLSRKPNSIEFQNSKFFIENQVKAYTKNGVKNAGVEALADFCQSLFALNETIYID